MKVARLGSPAAAIAALTFAAIGAAAAAATLQTSGGGLILSNSWGSGAHIGTGQDLREYLEPAPLSGPEIVAEFKRLCLDTGFDPAAHARAASGSAWQFKQNEIRLPGPGKQGGFAFADYRSRSAITSLWRGEGAEALKGRGYSSRTRGLIITGPVKAKDLYAPQCNLSLRTSGLSDAAPLAAALEQALGGPAAKVVLKTGYADGNWKIAGASGETRRVSFDVLEMKKPAQLVHLTVQTLPPAKPK
jgi:hypothetical protein